MMYKRVLLLFLCSLYKYDCARILAVFPTPSISHQMVFRPITQELVRRGHEVVIITPDPAFSKEGKPENLTEIDVHDVSYKIKREKFGRVVSTRDLKKQVIMILNMAAEVFESQSNTEEIQNIINKKTKPFDLILVEAFVLPALGFSHIFKVPVIQISSFLTSIIDLKNIGAPSHPLLYPTYRLRKQNNLSVQEKIKEIIAHLFFEKNIKSFLGFYDEPIKRIFGSDTPSITELNNNIDMIFLNTFPIWDSNRPVPPSVQYIGGIHLKPATELPEDLNSYLNASKHGVIYISFGTNVHTSLLPPQKIKSLTNVLSRLPYDVIWKWDKDELPGRSKNIKISKWLPQADLLRHPKIKLFINQGGLLSTDEAIVAGVPLLGIPMLGDHWFNSGMYVKHKIGLMIEMEDLNEDNLREAIIALTKDDTYRRNIEKIRSLLYDQPQTPLERAVWWTEHVLRHGGARHLRSPAANMPWTQYYEIELLTYLVAGLVGVILISILLLYNLFKVIRLVCIKKKLKRN